MPSTRRRPQLTGTTTNLATNVASGLQDSVTRDNPEQVPDCPFCLPPAHSQIVLSDPWCYSIWTQDTGTPAGSAMVLPWAHRPTVFDLTADEWASTATLLREMRELVARQHEPDGWNVGWNVLPVGGQHIPHTHCHLVPRYHGEPYAGRGIRSWIKDPSNRPAIHPSAK